MNKRHLYLICAIAAAGLLAAFFILRSSVPGGAGTVEHDDHQAAAASASTPGEGKIVLSDAQVRANGIVIATSGPRRITSSVHLTGEIHVNGERSIEVAARAGGLVETVPATLGQQVKKGDVLAVISSAQVADLRTELRTFEQRLALARTTLAREKTLWEAKISAEQDYLAARQGQQEAANSVENARQKLASIDAGPASAGRLARYEVRAPIAGTVIEKQVAGGASVDPDKALFTLADLSTVWLDLAVPAREFGNVAAGSVAQVRASGAGPTATAKVAWVSAVAAEASRSAVARIVLPNPHGAWRPGLFAGADIGSEPRDVTVAVARQAVHAVEGKDVVFVRTPGGFIAQPVTTGLADSEFIEIVSGLDAGVVHAAGGSNMVKAEHDKADADDAH